VNGAAAIRHAEKMAEILAKALTGMATLPMLRRFAAAWMVASVARL
jgi:hypothetical protein